MGRREFIAGLGSAAAWPLAARAQQPAMPVIAAVYPGSADTSAPYAAAFRKGLGETGYEPHDRQGARPHHPGNAAGHRGRGDPMIGRREFIAGLGSAAALPVVVRAQPRERMRRIGVLMNLAANDPESQLRMIAFVQSLQNSGWTNGQNVQIDIRWAAADPERFHRYAAELVALAPDVVLASTSPSVTALQQASRTVPIVFVQVTDPVGQGFVASLARPDGNVTGFSVYEYEIAPKWLELLKEIVPGVRRVAVLRHAAVVAGNGLLRAIQDVAPSFGLEVVSLGVHNANEIERGITVFGERPNGGLIVLASPLSAVHRDLIIALTAKHDLAAIYG
jgi:putative tryptophan/tyrosine transport system substrate-binding protein